MFPVGSDRARCGSVRLPRIGDRSSGLLRVTVVAAPPGRSLALSRIERVVAGGVTVVSPGLESSADESDEFVRPGDWGKISRVKEIVPLYISGPCSFLSPLCTNVLLGLCHS